MDVSDAPASRVTHAIDEVLVSRAADRAVLDDPWIHDALVWTHTGAEDIAPLAATGVEGSTPSARVGLATPQEYEEAYVRAEVVAARTAGRYLHEGRATSSLYWFAKLYELITALEVEMLREGLTEPGTGKRHHYTRPLFVAHFIPIFYELYQRHLPGDSYGRREMVPPHWRDYFRQCELADDPTSGWTTRLLRISVTLEHGVHAHIRGDMAPALVAAVRSFRERWPADTTTLEDIEEDFLARGVIVFPAAMDRMRSVLAAHAWLPEELVAGAGSALSLGPSLAAVYSWRRQAFAKARSALAR